MGRGPQMMIRILITFADMRIQFRIVAVPPPRALPLARMFFQVGTRDYVYMIDVHKEYTTLRRSPLILPLAITAAAAGPHCSFRWHWRPTPYTATPHTPPHPPLIALVTFPASVAHSKTNSATPNRQVGMEHGEEIRRALVDVEVAEGLLHVQVDSAGE